MTQRNLSAPTGAQINVAEPLYGAAADRIRDQLREPSDLEVAISVGQQLLNSDSLMSIREALRLLLRALDAEPVDPAEAIRRSVDAQFPVVAPFLAENRDGGEAR